MRWLFWISRDSLLLMDVVVHRARGRVSLTPQSLVAGECSDHPNCEAFAAGQKFKDQKLVRTVTREIACSVSSRAWHEKWLER